MTYWSLGTTCVPQPDGYCVCAIDEKGNFKRTASQANIPVGRVLVPTHDDQYVPDIDDPLGLLLVAQARAEDWTVQRDGHQWSAPLIFDSTIVWYDDEAPKRPACTLLQYAQLTQPATRILRLGFPMKLRARDDGNHDYTPINSEHGNWVVKYNGKTTPLDVLPRDALVAAFVSPHQCAKYAYLKLGSVLSIPALDIRLSPLARVVYIVLLRFRADSPHSCITYDDLRQALPEPHSGMSLHPELSKAISELARACRAHGLAPLPSLAVQAHPVRKYPSKWYCDIVYLNMPEREAVQQWKNDLAAVGTTAYPPCL